MTTDTTNSRPESTIPFRHPVDHDSPVSAGKDNTVLEFDQVGFEQDSHMPRFAGEMVLKMSNEAPRHNYYSMEAAQAEAQYKKRKYQMLKEFLGDYVPDTHFVIGSEWARVPKDEDKSRWEWKNVRKVFSLQERVPRYTIGEVKGTDHPFLTPEQRNSDELRSQMFGLVSRLQNMHKVMERARAIVQSQGKEFLLDDTLDLGPMSNFIRDHVDEELDASKLVSGGFKPSPNLLVDPESMKLYCIDFGAGQWSEEMSDQMALVDDIIAHDPDVRTKLPEAA